MVNTSTYSLQGNESISSVSSEATNLRNSVSCEATNSYELTSFPGPAQLLVAYSTIFVRAWESLGTRLANQSINQTFFVTCKEQPAHESL